MPAVQPLLLLPRPSRRIRHLRRPFTPLQPVGPYRLPHDVRDRLVAALAPARNRDAALALAVFLARFWSTPTRLVSAFPIDRRELADRADLGLTEAKVRGAIRALEEIGFLDRALAGGGSKHRAIGEGALHRKPVLYQFGSDYAAAFSMANKRARKARDRLSEARRSPGAATSSRVSKASGKPVPLKSPKSKGSEAEKVLMGDLTKPLPKPDEPNSPLEAALERWGRALRERAGRNGNTS